MSIRHAIAQRAERLDTLRRLRKEAAAEIDRLIAFLDDTGGDPDLEPDDDEPDNDAEPSLGSVHTVNQLRWSSGAGDDREVEHDGREPDADREIEAYA